MTLPYPNNGRVYLTNDFITKYIYDRISELKFRLTESMMFSLATIQTPCVFAYILQTC